VTSCSYHASKDAVGSCVICGKLICRACQSEIDGKSYCPPCVEKLFTTSEAKAQATPELAAAKPEGQAVNPGWWLLPVFLSLVGGLTAWLVNKDKDESTARYMLFGGLGMTIIQGLIIGIIVSTLVIPAAVKTGGQTSSSAGNIPSNSSSQTTTSSAGNFPSNSSSQTTTTAGNLSGNGSLQSTSNNTSSPTSSQSTSKNTVRTSTTKAKPDDFTAKESDINGVIGKICESMRAKDIEGTMQYFADDIRDRYKQAFAKSPDKLPQIADAMEKAKINFLSNKSDQGRIAEYIISSGGKDFSMYFAEIDGKWMLTDF
jgi:hypothetical protein